MQKELDFCGKANLKNDCRTNVLEQWTEKASAKEPLFKQYPFSVKDGAYAE